MNKHKKPGSVKTSWFFELYSNNALLDSVYLSFFNDKQQ